MALCMCHAGMEASFEKEPCIYSFLAPQNLLSEIQVLPMKKTRFHDSVSLKLMLQNDHDKQ